MNILVCVKTVPDDHVRIALGEDGTPELKGVASIVNAFDTYAVEMAVRFTEQNGGDVCVLSLGEESETRPGVVQMISVGAKKGWIGRYTSGDESSVAQTLSACIEVLEQQEGEQFDLILCGRESSDRISAAVGAMLAEKLHRPFLSNVVELSQSGETLLGKQETEEGGDIYALASGSVLTVGKPAYDPRYPGLKAKMAARKAVIPVLETDHAPSGVRHLGYKLPPLRQQGVKFAEKEVSESVDKALAALKALRVL